MGLAELSLLLGVGLLVFLASGIPVALALLLVGLGVFGIYEGARGLQILGEIPWSKGYNFTLMALPLFVFMGHVLQESGLVDRLFRMLSNWTSWIPGALGQVMILTSGVFAAISGSASAACATLGVVAYPELIKHGYNRRFSAGLISGGASLDPLIPPSTAMIVYATIAEQSVADLFIAGVMPGLLIMSMMFVFVAAVAILKPAYAPRPPAVSWRERFASLNIVPPALALVVIVLGGIYFGWFTPTEAAALSVALSIVTLFLYKGFQWRLLWQAAEKAAVTSGFLLTLLIAGFIFAHVLTASGLQFGLVQSVTDLGLSRWQLLAGLTIMYLIMGMFVSGATMTVLTIPVVAPILESMGFDLVWFGVMLMVFQEIGSMTPPFAQDFFIIQSVTGVSYKDCALGVIPFAIIYMIAAVILLAFPQISLWLPSTMKAI